MFVRDVWDLFNYFMSFFCDEHLRIDDPGFLEKGTQTLIGFNR